jgi:4-carboxymuconolactone decarboxylase
MAKTSPPSESKGKLPGTCRRFSERFPELVKAHEYIAQAIVLGLNTVGFSRTVAAWSWAQEQFERDRSEGESPS